MRASRSRRPLYLALLLITALGGACSRGGSNDGAETVGTVGSVRGSIDLVRDGATIVASEGDDLLAGDELRVEAPSSVNFTLGDEGKYQLVSGSARLSRSGAVNLTDGTLQISSGRPVEADLTGVELSFAGGTVRLDRSGNTGRVAAYEIQDLKLTSGSQEIPIPQLWQVAVIGDGEPDQARPLQFSRDDALDAANLVHALDADGKLGNLLRGLEPQLTATDGSALAERLRAAGIDTDSLARVNVASRSDQLMGLAFAREWKKDAPEELVKGFEQATALRVLGATWGLVAQNFDVNADGLVASLQSEITAVLFPPGREQADPLVPAPSPTQTARPATPRGSVQPAPAPAPAAPAAPTTPAPSPTPPGLVGPLLDPLRPLLPGELAAIIDELYGLVHGLLPIV